MTPTYLPYAEYIVALTVCEGRVFVATNKRVFKAQNLIDTERPELVELDFISADEYRKENDNG